MNEKRHAYLIIAHNEFGILKKLIKLLDYSENDIYVHIDKKVRNFQKEDFYHIVHRAGLFFVPRMKVSWGGYSMVKCELRLLEQAIRKEHAYYHLLSGVDLPLQSQDVIMKFFSKHEGREFINYDETACEKTDMLDRMRYYYFFQEYFGRNIEKNKLIYKLHWWSLYWQKRFGIDRIKRKNIIFGKGHQWFSITHDCAKYILARKKEIRKMFRYTICADEMFIQTIVANSDFRVCVSSNIHRLIDWKRGNPYTFTIEDADLLDKSFELFARKFSEKKDSEIAEMIYRKLIASA